jgi:hypothetical protein
VKKHTGIDSLKNERFLIVAVQCDQKGVIDIAVPELANIEDAAAGCELSSGSGSGIVHLQTPGAECEFME